MLCNTIGHGHKVSVTELPRFNARNRSGTSSM